MCAQHGGPFEECADPEVQWYPQRTICYAAMETAAANWRYDQLHEKEPYHDGSFQRWSKDRTLQFPFGARDGVTVWVARNDVKPGDDFLG